MGPLWGQSKCISSLPHSGNLCRYISDLTAVAAMDEEDAICPGDYTRLDTDLNSGNDGWFVFLCVQYIPQPFGAMLQVRTGCTLAHVKIKIK